MNKQIVKTPDNRKLPREVRMNALTETNRTWFLEFENWIINHPKNYSQGSIDQISSVVLKFLYDCGDHNANFQSIDEINFIIDSKRATTKNTKIIHVINFYTFITEVKQIKVPFSLDELSSLLVGSKVLKKDAEGGAAKELTIEQIILIRNLLKTDSVKLFAFEMVYQYGLKLNDLTQCVEKNYNYETRTFTIKRNGELVKIQIVTRIHEMIMENKSLLIQVQFTANQDRFNLIGKKLQKMGVLDRSIRWMDIEKTRQHNFFKCPGGCNKMYENTPEHWSIIQYTTDENNTKWIVCKSCAQKGIAHE